MLESLESDIDKESFDQILEFLIKNQKVKPSCYANKTCPSIPKEDQIKNIHTTDKDNLKEDFNNFKNLMINKFESMKYSFFKEVNSFKKQLLETSEIDPSRIQSQTDNINISSILERLIVQLQDQVCTLKNELDRKDKVINTLQEKLETKHQAITNGSSVVQTSSVIQAASVKTQHDTINMNQDSSINSITNTQNITQAITNTDVPPTSKENTKKNPILKMKVVLSAENLQNRTNQKKILNLIHNIRRQYDQTHK